MGDIQEELNRVEEGIRLLKIEYDRYFNGVLETPPDDDRQALERAFRRLRDRYLNSYADRYRLSSLEARLTSLSGLWTRRIREEEVGAGQAPSAAAAHQGPDPYAGIVISRRASPDSARALYQELYGTSGRSEKTDFDSFRKFLKVKTEQIRAKTGCTEVRFRIASRGGKLTLKAKPVSQ